MKKLMKKLMKELMEFIIPFVYVTSVIIILIFALFLTVKVGQYLFKDTEADKLEIKKNIEFCTKQANKDLKYYNSCMQDIE